MDAPAPSITERQAISVKLLLTLIGLFGPPCGLLLMMLNDIRWEVKSLGEKFQAHLESPLHGGSVSEHDLRAYVKLLQAQNPDLKIPPFEADPE